MALKIKKGGVELTIGLAVVVLIIILIVFYWNVGTGGFNFDFQDTKTKAIIVAVVAIALIILAMIYAKIDSPKTLLGIGMIGASIVAMALFLPDLLSNFSNTINIDIPPLITPEIRQAIEQKIYKEYARPGEVYLVGNNYLQSLASAAGVDLCNFSILGLCLRWKTYVGIVYPVILEIKTTKDNPQTVWNSVFWLKKFPLDVVVNNQRYVVYCQCDIREYSWIFGYPVTTPSGNTYDPDLNYTHVPQTDGEYVINNPPR